MDVIEITTVKVVDALFLELAEKVAGDFPLEEIHESGLGLVRARAFKASAG